MTAGVGCAEQYDGIWKWLGLDSSGVLLQLLPIAIAIAIVGSVLAIVLCWLPPVRSDFDA